MKNLIVIAIVWTSFSCRQQGSKEAPAVFPGQNASLKTTAQQAEFKCPVVVYYQEIEPREWAEFARPPLPWRDYQIRLVLPRLGGVSKFCDTLHWEAMDDWRLDLDIETTNDTTGASASDIEIVPNFQRTLVFGGHMPKSSIFPEKDALYGSYILGEGNQYYPVYVVNQTAKDQLFFGKDSHIFAIQEAIDKNGEWRPIEARGNDWCGNGSWRLTIPPNEFLAFLMPKYSGDYKTKIRVRVKSGKVIYLSSPFDGSINEGQFHFPKYALQHFKGSGQKYPYYDFYGALPLRN